jgi:hypothetical protein
VLETRNLKLSSRGGKNQTQVNVTCQVIEARHSVLHIMGWKGDIEKGKAIVQWRWRARDLSDHNAKSNTGI